MANLKETLQAHKETLAIVEDGRFLTTDEALALCTEEELETEVYALDDSGIDQLCHEYIESDDKVFFETYKGEWLDGKFHIKYKLLEEDLRELFEEELDWLFPRTPGKGTFIDGEPAWSYYCGGDLWRYEVLSGRTPREMAENYFKSIEKDVDKWVDELEKEYARYEEDLESFKEKTYAEIKKTYEKLCSEDKKACRKDLMWSAVIKHNTEISPDYWDSAPVCFMNKFLKMLEEEYDED